MSILLNDADLVVRHLGDDRHVTGTPAHAFVAIEHQDIAQRRLHRRTVRKRHQPLFRGLKEVRIGVPSSLKIAMASNNGVEAIDELYALPPLAIFASLRLVFSTRMLTNLHPTVEAKNLARITLDPRRDQDHQTIGISDPRELLPPTGKVCGDRIGVVTDASIAERPEPPIRLLELRPVMGVHRSAPKVFLVHLEAVNFPDIDQIKTEGTYIVQFFHTEGIVSRLLPTRVKKMIPVPFVLVTEHQNEVRVQAASSRNDMWVHSAEFEVIAGNVEPARVKHREVAVERLQLHDLALLGRELIASIKDHTNRVRILLTELPGRYYLKLFFAQGKIDRLDNARRTTFIVPHRLRDERRHRAITRTLNERPEKRLHLNRGARVRGELLSPLLLHAVTSRVEHHRKNHSRDNGHDSRDANAQTHSLAPFRGKQKHSFTSSWSFVVYLEQGPNPRHSYQLSKNQFLNTQKPKLLRAQETCNYSIRWLFCQLYTFCSLCHQQKLQSKS